MSAAPSVAATAAQANTSFEERLAKHRTSLDALQREQREEEAACAALRADIAKLKAALDARNERLRAVCGGADRVRCVGESLRSTRVQLQEQHAQMCDTTGQLTAALSGAQDAHLTKLHDVTASLAAQTAAALSALQADCAKDADTCDPAYLAWVAALAGGATA
eukprot:Rhum_TRINITY_DN21619_c0_g1::Rhum_TRINITY_DN21619_c0_g1_i1::g.174405::m.174405